MEGEHQPGKNIARSRRTRHDERHRASSQEQMLSSSAGASRSSIVAATLSTLSVMKSVIRGTPKTRDAAQVDHGAIADAQRGLAGWSV